MMDPLTALVIGTLVIVAGAALFWPDRGLYWSFRRGRHSTARVLVEDALKHIHDFDSRQLPVTVESLAGALGIARPRSAELLERLVELGLVDQEAGRYELSADGRAEALRVIRVHRLWERYLSDYTGVPPTQWHRIADEREHSTTAEQAGDLAAATGYASYDPHGDPIPRADGTLPVEAGIPLGELEPGVLAEIVHIEDEPESIYAQLLAEGLFVGMNVRVTAHEPLRTTFEGDGEEHVLAPLLVANLTVLPLEDPEEMSGPFDTLDQIELGMQARVIGISPRCRLPERRRMFDLGFLPGTLVQPELRSPGGDPTGYRVRDAVIALRSEQAALVRVVREARA